MRKAIDSLVSLKIISWQRRVYISSCIKISSSFGQQTTTRSSTYLYHHPSIYPPPQHPKPNPNHPQPHAAPFTGSAATSLPLSSPTLSPALFSPISAVSKPLALRYSLKRTSSSSMVSWPTSGRKNQARAPAKMARLEATQKGSWPLRVALGALSWMTGKTQVPTKAPILPMAAAMP